MLFKKGNHPSMTIPKMERHINTFVKIQIIASAIERRCRLSPEAPRM
jgi:hypothetical protein